MQNFESGNRDTLSGEEARQVLQAWADRHQASGVDPSVKSVKALAAGLGVSEDEVQRMVEDVRVHQRSHQIAAGILSQESARRKNLDVTAAIGAAIAFIVLALAAGALLVMRSTNSTTSVVIDGIPTPPAPPAVVTGEPKHLSIQSDDGTSVVIDGFGIQVNTPDGETLLPARDSARALLESQIAEIQKQRAEIERASAGRALTMQEKARIKMLDSQVKALRAGLERVPQAPVGN